MKGLLVRIDRGLTRLTLSDPARRNPLTGRIRSLIGDALAGTVARGCRVALIDAMPHDPPIFSAGADLDDIASLTAIRALDFSQDGQRLFTQVESLPAWVVAAVDGPCRGGALDLVLACDVILASSRATFAHPGARLGIVTGWGGTSRLPERLGLAAARAAFATARVMSADDALSLGLVDELLPGAGDDFAEAAAARSRDLDESSARWPPSEIAVLKRVARAGRPALDHASCRLLARSRGFRHGRGVCYPPTLDSGSAPEVSGAADRA